MEPKIIITDTDDVEKTTHDFSSGNAGAFLPDSVGIEIRVWNDQAVEGRITATNVKFNVRDSGGGFTEEWVKRHWVEAKSNGTGGDGEGIVDDAMTEFQPIGLNKPLECGDIPSNTYRTVYLRLRIPTSGISGVKACEFTVEVQNPASSISVEFTEVGQNCLVYDPDGCGEVSINGEDASLLDIEKLVAYINSIRVYHGSAIQYDVSALDDDDYKLYIDTSGDLGSTTGSVSANAVYLADFTVVSGEATVVSDKRVFYGVNMFGIDAAKSASPEVGWRFFAFDTEKIYICVSAGSWTELYTVIASKKVQMAHFQDLKAADTDHIHAAITGNGAEQEITTGITNPDYGRVATITTTNVSSPSGDITIEGLVRGAADSDIIAIIPGSTAIGVKALDTITKITIPDSVSADDMVEVGIGDILGLPKEITAIGDVYKKKVNDEDKTSELSGKINATYGTVDCSTIVAYEETTIWYLAYS